jgi:hypothetical protein
MAKLYPGRRTKRSQARPPAHHRSPSVHFNNRAHGCPDSAGPIRFSHRYESRIRDATKTRTVNLEGDVYDPSGTISVDPNQLGTTLCETLPTDRSDKGATGKQAMKAVTVKLDSMRSEYDKLSSGLELSEGT